MLRYLEAKTPVHYQSLPKYADYFQQLPGAMQGYRALDPLPVDGTILGDELVRLRVPSPGTLVGGRVAVMSKEAHTLLSKAPGYIGLALKQFGRYWFDLRSRSRSRRDRRLTLGNALVGGLRRALPDRNVPLWLNAPMRELLEDEGRVSGVTVERDGQRVRVLARRDVIFAAGGFERNLPGCVIVNGHGKRFVNEAAPYSEFVPAWMIFDARFRQHYPCGPIMPAAMMPDAFRSLLYKADMLDALAAQIGVNAQGLSATVTKMNRYAATGVDEDFGKGGSLFDTYYGDSSVEPNPCLAPLEKGPFYAVRIDAGDIGTKGGLVTDASARVLRGNGTQIAGLYAIGNTGASMMGKSYPGASSTLGLAMTFGYIAANHLADGGNPAASSLSASTSELRGVTP
ncbi:MAG: 3-oxosteroid 1-dehydrogenase (EC [uncultured Paraburkholderia sp.]|nr:MAG: 3-oxosteroid 1-dehydrogenase (EC [uncultured Paraburkholderia sp.]CAH2939179.1 MAG: 3-oxosteroid 1-dehydrogenase (EC [uncultured Paraburkholderia sp.]